jgi:hypothetical protein
MIVKWNGNENKRDWVIYTFRFGFGFRWQESEVTEKTRKFLEKKKQGKKKNKESSSSSSSSRTLNNTPGFYPTIHLLTFVCCRLLLLVQYGREFWITICGLVFASLAPTAQRHS